MNMLFLQKKLFLLDGTSLLYRAHFALGNASISTRQGIKTGGILGFVNTLVEVLQKESPTHLVIAFDAKEKTFRHALFPAYKAHRPTQPEEVTLALSYIQQLLDAWPIVHITYAGYEADDILGTLAHKAATLGFITYIMTTDKDLAQVVQPNTYLYKPGYRGQKAIILGEKEILKEWSIHTPSQVCDILALEGDSSDAIPGIPSIGRKTAQKLIQKFGSLENLLANSNQLSEKLQATILPYAQQSIQSKQLATICTDLPIPLDLNQCSYQGANRTELEPLLNLLEFKQLKKRILGTNSLLGVESLDKDNNYTDFMQEKKYPPCHTTFLTTPAEYHTLLEQLAQVPLWAFALHATSLDPYHAQLQGIAFSYTEGEVHYVSLPAEPSTYQLFLQLFTPCFLHSTKIKIASNLKYTLLILHRHGVYVAGPLFDILIAQGLVPPDVRSNLATLTKMPPIHSSDHSALYTNSCAALGLKLYSPLLSALKAEGVAGLFYQVEMPLIEVLVTMEQAGVSIDLPFLASLKEEMQVTSQELQQKIYTIAGLSFNINSPKQLGEVLFEKLKIISNSTKTKSGQYATGEEILEKLSKKHPIIPTIMEYRALQKLLSTYVETLPTMVNPIDQRIHTSYHQTVVITGRLSSTNPNLQNIPIKSPQGRKLRQAFIPYGKEDLLFSADYSQIELRIMAAYTQDPTLLTAFKEDKDIHHITASKLFKVSLTKVDEEMRRKAKIVNFSIMYGISAFGLAQRMENLSQKEAAQLIAAYFEEFPGIKSYMEQTIAYAQTHGYVTTLLGRKRFLPDIHSRNAHTRDFAKRNAINTPIQGSAAEMIKLAMVNIHHWLQSNRLKTTMMMQVHDELVFNVPKIEIAYIQKHIPLLMEEALPLSNVPIKVNCGSGANWLEAH